jgi:diguanylate cyclase (GGDEF)-like protein/PAS domain S-box-containing protein
MFARAISGDPVSVYDIDQVAEWRAQPERVRQGQRSALHIPLRSPSHTGLLVCTHSARGYFRQNHIWLARRFAMLGAEALLRIELEKALTQRDRFFTLALDLMCITTPAGVPRQLSSGWEQTLGYEYEELRDNSLMNVVCAEDLETVRAEFRQLHQIGGASSFEARLRCKDGSKKSFLWNAAFVSSEELIYATARDITELKSAQHALKERSDELNALTDQLKQAALTDPLTGLRNRRFISEQIDSDLATVRRAYTNVRMSRPPNEWNIDLGVLLIDLDYFKRTNDDFGHGAGDAVLVEFAKRLKASVREVDTVVRWGGEEFLVVLRQANHAYLRVVAERILSKTRDTPVVLPKGVNVPVTCSVGYCHYPFAEPGRFSWDDVVRLADAALYFAKRSGRDRSVGFSKGALIGEAPSASTILHDIRDSIRHQWIESTADVDIPSIEPGPDSRPIRVLE